MLSLKGAKVSHYQPIKEIKDLGVFNLECNIKSNTIRKKQRVALGHILSQTRHDFLLTRAYHLDVEELRIASAKEFAKGKKRFRLYYM